jgi:hypothetical protein
MSSNITIALSDEAMARLEHMKTPSEYGPYLVSLFNEDMKAFDEYMQEKLGGGIIPMERTILCTYLHWKVTGGNGKFDIANLERRPIADVVEVISPDA